MGLDMYLTARRYISGYGFEGEAERKRFAAVLEVVGIDDSHCKRCATPSGEVSITAAYWRKANHIHRWFVENVQDGSDDCQSSYVERRQLQELIATCKDVLASVETVQGKCATGTVYHRDGKVEHQTQTGRVIAQQSIAQDKLPTQAGFFFGGTDYDEFYLRDVESTVEMLEAVLNDDRLEGWEFYYRASW